MAVGAFIGTALIVLSDRLPRRRRELLIHSAHYGFGRDRYVDVTQMMGSYIDEENRIKIGVNNDSLF